MGMTMLVNTLADHNGVIDDNPQHQQEGKGRHDI